MFKEDALNDNVFFVFGESLAAKEISKQCASNQVLVVESATIGRGLGGSEDRTREYSQNLGTELLTELGDKTLRLELGCDCVEGYIKRPNEANECIACGPGRFRSDESEETCSKCSPGSYQPLLTAATSCTLCPSGTYAIGSGADECTPCPSELDVIASSFLVTFTLDLTLFFR